MKKLAITLLMLAACLVGVERASAAPRAGFGAHAHLPSHGRLSRQVHLSRHVRLSRHVHWRGRHGWRSRLAHFRHFGRGGRHFAHVRARDFQALASPAALSATFGAQALAATPNAAESTLGRPLELHPLLNVARRYIGRSNFTHHGGPWCRDAINVWMRQAGYRLANNSRRAIDALRLGHRVSAPRPGDLAVMRHHVTIFTAWGGRGLIGLGGNQGHRVKYSNFSRRSVIAFVRPN